MQLSLSSKFNLVIGILTALTTAAIGGLLVYETSQDKNRSLVQRGAELAEMLAESGRRAIYSGDRDAARRLLLGLAAHPDVAFSRVLGAEGTSLARRTLRKDLTLPPPPARERLPSEGARYTELTNPRDGARYVDRERRSRRESRARRGLGALGSPAPHATRRGRCHGGRRAARAAGPAAVGSVELVPVDEAIEPRGDHLRRRRAIEHRAALR